MYGLTVDNLIKRLAELSEDGYGDTEVRIATQPSWPLAYYVGPVKYVENEDDYEAEDEDAAKGYVWVATGDSPYDMPYAPREAWDDYF